MNKTLVAILIFASVRYYLPRTLLNQKMNMKEMIVLSLCYGLAVYAIQYLSEKESLK